VRDYIHIGDLTRAHLMALAAMDGNLRTAMNLGTGRGYSVKEVLDCVRKVTGKPLNVVESGRREGDPALLVASVEKAWDLLGWRAEKRELSDIIQSAWNFIHHR